MRRGGNILFKFNYQEELKKNNHLSNYIVHSIQAGIILENGDDMHHRLSSKLDIAEPFHLIKF
jgi:hypothetical protein